MRLLFVIAVLAPSAAFANPDGAPWDSAGAPGGRDCTACHFDTEAERASPLIQLNGLPQRIRAGKTYRLTLSLSAEPEGLAGFLMRAESGGGSAGKFKALDGRTETTGAAVRSTFAGLAHGPEEAVWTFAWTAPDEPENVVFYVAANIGNDDASPLGDRILTATFRAD